MSTNFGGQANISIFAFFHGGKQIAELFPSTKQPQLQRAVPPSPKKKRKENPSKTQNPSKTHPPRPSSSQWTKTHDFPLVKGAAAVGGGQGGGALLQVPGLVAVLGGAADGDGVDAVGVAVAGAVVALPAAVSRRPDENGAQPPATLRAERGRGEERRGLGGMNAGNGAGMRGRWWEEVPDVLSITRGLGQDLGAGEGTRMGSG